MWGVGERDKDSPHISSLYNWVDGGAAHKIKNSDKGPGFERRSWVDCGHFQCKALLNYPRGQVNNWISL